MTGDNFDLVYDAQGWHGPPPNDRILLLIMLALIQRDKTDD